MNIDQRSFIDLRGHQNDLYIALIITVRRSISSIFTSDCQGIFLFNIYFYLLFYLCVPYYYNNHSNCIQGMLLYVQYMYNYMYNINIAHLFLQET